jgi:hypothetical protein
LSLSLREISANFSSIAWLITSAAGPATMPIARRKNAAVGSRDKTAETRV